MTTTWVAKAGDKHRRITLDLVDLDATGATGVTFRMRPRNGGALVFTAPGTVTPPTQVSYQFTGTQLDTPGEYLLEATLTFPDGEETAPTSGYVVVSIEPRLS